MSLESTWEVRDGYLLLRAAGEITGDSVLQLGSEIRRRCEADGVGGVVIDCQGMTGALGVAELITVTPAFVRIVGPTIKVAYINPPSHWIPADDQFSRDLAYNRGAFLEVFPSESEAVEWLRDA